MSRGLVALYVGQVTPVITDVAGEIYSRLRKHVYIGNLANTGRYPGVKGFCPTIEGGCGHGHPTPVTHRSSLNDREKDDHFRTDVIVHPFLLDIVQVTPTPAWRASHPDHLRSPWRTTADEGSGQPVRLDASTNGTSAWQMNVRTGTLCACCPTSPEIILKQEYKAMNLKMDSSHH